MWHQECDSTTIVITTIAGGTFLIMYAYHFSLTCYEEAIFMKTHANYLPNNVNTLFVLGLGFLRLYIFLPLFKQIFTSFCRDTIAFIYFEQTIFSFPERVLLQKHFFRWRTKKTCPTKFFSSSIYTIFTHAIAALFFSYFDRDFALKIFWNNKVLYKIHNYRVF